MRRALLVSWLSALALAACEPAAHSTSTGGAAGLFEPDAGQGGRQAAAGGNAGVTFAGMSGAPGAAGLEDAAGSAGASGSAGADDSACDASSVGDLEVNLRNAFDWDPLGYPPYAFADCTLVYIAAGNDAGALHLRNLATGDDVVLEPATSRPRRPAVSGSVIAWEATGALGSEVRVRYEGRTATLAGAFVRAEEPRAANDAVVFTAFLGSDPNSDSDVYLFDVRSGELSLMGGGAGQQRFADVSATHVAFTDFSEAEKGYFDESGSVSDIVLVDRASGTRSTRVAPGKQAFPLLGTGGVFAYLEWAAVHPEPKLGQFWLKAGSLDRPVSEDVNVKPMGQVSTNPAYIRPSLHGLNLDFVDQGADGVALYRAALGAPNAPVPLKIAGSLQLFGPVAGDRFTLLANQRSAQSFALLAIPR